MTQPIPEIFSAAAWRLVTITDTMPPRDPDEDDEDDEDEEDDENEGEDDNDPPVVREPDED